MENTDRFSQDTKWSAIGITLAGLGALAIARAVYRRATSLDFKNKVVVITGGSRGLGLEIARIFASKGASIVICARSQEHLNRAADELNSFGAQVLTVAADLAHQNQAQIVVERVIEQFGRIDLLINNAGMMTVGPENVMEIHDYQRVMDVNCWSALYMIKAALPHMRAQRGGRIANICSIGGKVAVPHMLPYSVSKFALTGLSEGLAGELKNENIIVTTVIPNLMRTGSPRNVSVNGAHQKEYAWFKIADSLPMISQNARVAASQIVQGIASGDREVILTPTARAALLFNGIAPGAITTMMQWADQFMPQSGNGETKKGFQSESEATTGSVGKRSDAAAARNNEL